MKKTFQVVALVGFVIGFLAMIALPGYKEITQDTKGKISLGVWLVTLTATFISFIVRRKPE